MDEIIDKLEEFAQYWEDKYYISDSEFDRGKCIGMRDAYKMVITMLESSDYVDSER